VSAAEQVVERQGTRFVINRSSVRIAVGTSAVVTEVFRGFPEYFQANVGLEPRLGLNRLLQNPFQLSSFIERPTVPCYIVSTLQASLIVLGKRSLPRSF
jgi:hypothetical protein